jgi:hypothetical protein
VHLASLLLFLACSPNTAPQATSLAHTRTQSILLGAQAMARLVANGSPVVTHCSDGWDRTAQVRVCVYVGG